MVVFEEVMAQDIEQVDSEDVIHVVGLVELVLVEMLVFVSIKSTV